ncbi:MAG: shikimate kinase AroK [Gammaproteobacteria bacterium]|nr:shikimate kinase AroK [Gammaproteobacteria bacterium]
MWGSLTLPCEISACLIHPGPSNTIVDRLFLIGPMGAGKTAIGRELARLLGREFIDTDHEIERRTGVDIPLIFDKEGEAGFRRRERQVIEELSQKQNIVLATGGGVVLDPANRACLQKRGFVIYLKASVNAQSNRTGHNPRRPLLTAENREERLQELFMVREPLYESIAQLTIITDRGRVNRLALHIQQELEKRAPVSINASRTS